MLDKILKEFSSPFYLYDEDKIKNKINFLNNLELEFPRKFNFAVKANPNLAILNLIHRCGFGAEVVSAGELFKSLKAGFVFVRSIEVRPKVIGLKKIKLKKKNSPIIKYKFTKKIKNK